MLLGVSPGEDKYEGKETFHFYILFIFYILLHCLHFYMSVYYMIKY